MALSRRMGSAALILTCVLSVSFGHMSASSPKDTLHPGMPAPGSFQIAETAVDEGGGTTYRAKASDTCAFDIVLKSSKSVAESVFTIVPVELARRTGADCSAFLKALAPELGHKGRLPSPPAAVRLKASAVILGVNQNRQTSGGFSARPAGSWLVTKLFLADDEGEVFLNLNATDGVGEFSVKDEDDADIVVRELAKILLPGSAVAE